MLSPAKNYFELFDLPTSFAVDMRLLAERYRAVVRWLRAEALLSAEDGDPGDSAYALGVVDEAYRTLTDPMSRAQYLCRLHDQGLTDEGSEIAQDKAGRGTSLMEQIELEETLVAAANRSDPAAAVAEVVTQLVEQSAALDKELQALFANPSPENLNAARDIVRYLEILWRCRQDAEARQARLVGRD